MLAQTLASEPSTARTTPTVLRCAEHTVEIVSDSGEGAQKCGQIFGAVSAKMGNGVWTVEIIPAEIQPPPRIPEGASGNRIRIGSGSVTNWGDETNLVVAFNEQVLLARHRLGALASDATVLLESKWASHPDEDVVRAWHAALDELSARRYRIIPVPMEEQCLTLVDNPRKGKNMFALGLLACIYDRDMDRIRDQIAYAFRKKSEEVYEQNVKLLQLGFDWANDNLDFRIDVQASPAAVPVYDGIAAPDEPYRYVSAPADASKTAPPTLNTRHGYQSVNQRCSAVASQRPLPLW